MTFRLLGIPGSLRAGSHNARLLKSLAASAPAEIELAVFSELGSVPLFNEDIEGETPLGVSSLWSRIRDADALVFATPEYNQSLPGVLKNAIDWMTRDPRGSPLRGKPAAVVGATVGMWGTRLAQQQLRTVLIACGALVMPTPVLFSAQVGERFPADEQLTDYMQAVLADLRPAVAL